MKVTKEGIYTHYKGVPVLQGGLPDFGTEWWSEQDWKNHEESEKRLKASGEWGKYVKMGISIVNNTLYDSPRHTPQSSALESHELVLFDFGI